MEMRTGTILCLFMLAAILPASGSDRDAPSSLRCFTASPFAMDLWEDRSPASARPVDAAHPLELFAALGERESALLVILAKEETATVTCEVAPLAQARASIPASLQVIRSVRRANPYCSVAGDRYGDRYSRESGLEFPDILVRDEPRFLRAIAKDPKLLPERLPDGPAVLAPIPVGQYRYLLFTVTVPPTAPPGDYRGEMRIGESERLPVLLHVYPFALEPVRDRILGVSNEFARPGNPLFEPSLALLGEAGMNFTRIADIVSPDVSKSAFALLSRLGYRTLVEHRPPRDAADLRRVPDSFRLFFYGVDEPQPKDRARSDWRKLAQHVRRSREIHSRGGKVMTSLPYRLALELRDGESRPYQELATLGLDLDGVVEPLDWANYGLGVQRLTRPRRRSGETNADLFAYLRTLQEEFAAADWASSSPLSSKHDWIETYYWPQGLIRYPYFARLLFGFYLHESHLDGVMAWTLFRVRGGSPFEEGALPVATLAYPGGGSIYSTYSLVAAREGVDDLRYAEQACRAIGELLAAKSAKRRNLGARLKGRFLEILSPYRELTPGGRRIDLESPDPEAALHATRRALADLIQTAQN